MRLVSRRCAGAGLVLALMAAFCTSAWAQPGAPQRQSGQGNPPSGPSGLPSAGRAGSKEAAQKDAMQPKQLNPADQAIKDAFAKSKDAAAVDDFTAILNECRSGLEQGPSAEGAAYAKKLQAWAYNKRGEKLAEQGDEQRAMSDFEAAIQHDPRLWKAVHNRGVSRAGAGDTKGAMTDFTQVIRLNPEYANAWYNRGELKYDQGDYQNALGDYNRAIDLQPRDGGFYNSRGHTNYRLGRLREALSDYNRSVQIDPNNAAALVNRGDAYREQAIYGPAANDYREAVRIDPKLGRAYLSVAWLMATCPDQRYRDPEKAVSAAQKAIELDGDRDYRYLDTLAAALASAGNFDEAKATADKAAKRAPAKEAENIKKRVELYGGGRAYREGAPGEVVRSASAGR